MNYLEIKNQEPVLFECFFAFSNEQMAKGIKKTGIEGKEILSGGGGLYGTREGIKQLFDYYDNQSLEIAKNCDPQEVYNYEFGNHECSYTCDDSEAISIVVNYFGIERAKTVKRRFAYNTICDK